MTCLDSSYEKGSISIITLLLLPLSITVFLMVIILGQLIEQRINLDRALDDAALAAAFELDQTPQGFLRAQTLINSLLSHSQISPAIDLSQINITFGPCPHLLSPLDGIVNQTQTVCNFVSIQNAMNQPQGLIYVAIDSGLQMTGSLLFYLSSLLPTSQLSQIHSLAIAGRITPYSARLSQ